MKKTIILWLFLLFSISKSQSLTFKNTSLDFITDASSAAMGESFVANPNGNFSFFENPAALPNNSSPKLFYYTRSQGWMKLAENYNYSSAGFTSSTFLGNIGIGFSRFTSGRIPINIFDNTTSTQGYEDHNQTLMLSMSRNIFNALSFGAGLKVFYRSLESYGGQNYQINSNYSFLIDLGLLTHFKNILASKDNSDNLYLGCSIQNFGTDYEEEYKNLFNEKVKQILPRFLRFGFAYEVNLLLGQKSPTNINLLFTGEYKNLLNPGNSEKTDVDYWGCGIEATLFKIVSLRLGGIISPESNVLFDRAKFQTRYGIGLNIPMALIGIETPLKVRLDYAIIPVNQITVYDINGNQSKSKSSLYAFGISISYIR